MIDLRAVTARAAPLALQPLTAKLDAGVHALLGTRDDGVRLALDVMSGRARPRSGLVQLLGGSPRDASIRAAVAYVPLDAALPDALRVDEAMAMAAEIRGRAAPSPEARLASLGIEALAARPVRSLAKDEARAVSLAEAVTSGARALFVEEPFTLLDPRAGALVAQRLRACAADGACVVIATSSVRDALSLADHVLTFDRGALMRNAPVRDPLAFVGPHGACLRAVASDARALVAELAKEAACEAVESDAGANAVLVRGPDPEALAAAVARAALRANVVLDALVADAPPLGELRAAIAGAYQAAPPPAAPPASPPPDATS